MGQGDGGRGGVGEWRSEKWSHEGGCGRVSGGVSGGVSDGVGGLVGGRVGGRWALDSLSCFACQHQRYALIEPRAPTRYPPVTPNIF